MNPEQLSANLRLRNSWQAADLGVRMLQAWGSGSVWLLWLAMFWAPWAMLSLWIGPWAAVVMWWLLPLYDRLWLVPLSQNLFGQQPGWQQVFSATIQQWRHDGLSAITIKRLDFSRSFSLPVYQLEQLKGKQAKQRSAVLNRGEESSRAVLLGMLWFLFVWLLAFGAMALWAVFQPEHMQPTSMDLDDIGALPEFEEGWQITVAWMLGVSVLHPFYVGSGFALYLSRRSHLEAWDIELVFRKLIQRQQQWQAPSKPTTPPASRSVPTLLLSALLAGLLATSMSDPAQAEESQHTLSYCEQIAAREQRLQDSGRISEQALGQLKDDDRFIRCKRFEHWERRPETKPETNKAAPKENNGSGSSNSTTNNNWHGPSDWWGALSGLLAGGIQPLMWGILALMVLLAIAWAISAIKGQPLHRSLFGRRTSVTTVPQSTVSSHALQAAPRASQDLGQQAWQAWQEGDPRQALSYLYQGCLRRLEQLYGHEYELSDTEAECLLLTRKEIGSNNPHYQYLRALTRQWQTVAYAERLPRAEVVEQLCQRWATEFEQAAAQVTAQATTDQGAT